MWFVKAHVPFDLFKQLFVLFSHIFMWNLICNYEKQNSDPGMHQQIIQFLYEKRKKKNDSNSNQIRRSNGNIFSRYVLCYLKLVGNHMKWNQRLFHYKCIAINRNGAIPSLYISVYLVYACRLSIYNSAEGNFFWPTNEDIVVCQFKNWIWWL